MATQAEAEEAEEEVDVHEEARKSRTASLLAQEVLPAPDAYVISMLKEKLNALPKERAPLTAQQAFGKGEGEQEKKRLILLDRIKVQEALTVPDPLVLEVLRDKLQTLPKEKVAQVAEPKQADPGAAARDAAALEVAKQRQMTKMAD